MTDVRDDSFNTEILNSSAKDAMRSIFLLNGGASIAMLGFLGSVAGDASSFDLNAVVLALWYFGLGLIFVAIAYGCDYFNMLSWRYKYDLSSFTFTIFGIVFAAASLMMFFVGSYIFADTIVL